MINNQLFILKTIPSFHPLSNERLLWWKEQKRYCIEGYWSSGKWMPPNLYFYINFWKIRIKKSEHSKQETLSSPFLRDIDWDKAYLYQEAKGFSGFSDDIATTCSRLYAPTERALNMRLGIIPDDKKIFVPAREYLRRIHNTNLGYPLYENEARNVIDIESRGTGKSYFAACNIAHNFLFDGATNYDAFLGARIAGQPMTSETLVGAVDAKYSRDLLTKVELGLSNLPGSMKYGTKYYPPPFLPEFQGTLQPGKYIEAVREIKVGSNWILEGSHSKVHHRSFGDNDFAGNGTRPNLAYLEEVGFMKNLVGSLGALTECTANGSVKFGMIWMMGTGGDMDGGSTMAAKEVFYNPEGFDCLMFDDPWESKGKIGYFVPATLGLNQFKDSEGVTDEIAATQFLQEARNKKARSKSKRPLNDELQNRPLKPSEAFLVTIGNRFPIKELQTRLIELETNELYRNTEYIGDLTLTDEGKYKWGPSATSKPIYNYPLTKDDSEEGGIIIYSHPFEDEYGGVPFGRYLAGNDPYDQSKAVYSESLGSLLIYDKLNKRIVAEYTGRPATYKEYYEQARRLLKYFNARCLYENEKKGFFDYLDSRNETFLLLDQPDFIIREISPNSKVSRGKGIHMTGPIKEFGEELINTWLLESAEDPDHPEHLNLHKLRCIALIKELIAYNEEGNFDRVMALMMVMFHIQEMRRHLLDEKKISNTVNNDPFFKRDPFKKRIAISGQNFNAGRPF